MFQNVELMLSWSKSFIHVSVLFQSILLGVEKVCAYELIGGVLVRGFL